MCHSARQAGQIDLLEAAKFRTLVYDALLVVLGGCEFAMPQMFHVT